MRAGCKKSTITTITSPKTNGTIRGYVIMIVMIRALNMRRTLRKVLTPGNLEQSPKPVNVEKGEPLKSNPESLLEARAGGKVHKHCSSSEH
jgi:hypothetical protein